MSYKDRMPHRKKVLITGGTGFFGSILKLSLTKAGFDYINFDTYVDPNDSKKGKMFQGDIRVKKDIERCFKQHGPIDIVCHLAAQLAHETKSRNYLWESNVLGTKHLVSVARRAGVKKFVFTSSNCLWGEPLSRPIKENDIPCPVELYGKSKWEGEKIISRNRGDMMAIIFRSPTIIAAGRMGLLSILFEFIEEGRKIWLLGGGHNKYQFIYAPDYARAIIMAINKCRRSVVLNVGSDKVVSFNQMYTFIIKKSRSVSRLIGIPKAPMIFLMKLAYMLRLSPLGPYQYKMIAEDFEFDTSQIKRLIGWSPTKTNTQMLYEAYVYYKKQKKYIEEHKKELPTHKRPAKKGILLLIKHLS